MIGAAELALGLALASAAPPAPAAPQADTSYGCIVCHAEKRRSFRVGIHAERGIRCHDCHRGDPRALERSQAHARGFLGAPDKLETIRVCTTCHADPDRMRPFGLPADQLAELRTSRHGQLLLGRRNTDAPTCTDCHDAHTILPPNDARSSVHPANIPGTCARCHQDRALMARYGLPTNQLEEYRVGAHGIAVFERQNFAAPTCIGCHGSHAALPPRVTEVTLVCERCHQLLGQALAAGPHGPPSATGGMPGCLACHGNHGTERVAPDSIARACTGCHGAQSRAATVGLALQEEVVRATRDLAAAAEAIAELERHGRPVRDARHRYRGALTAYQQIGQVQHSLDLERLADLGRRVGSVSRDIRASAEVSAERRWEHKLLLVPVWFLALSALAVGTFKLAELRQRGEES